MRELKEDIEPKEAREQKVEWQAIYREYFHIDIDPTKVRVPKRTKEQIDEGFTRLILVHESMTPEDIFKKREDLFESWKYEEDLNTITSERNPKDKTYAIWVKDTEEPDEDMKDKSAKDIKEQGITTETLEERLLHELKYFRETGKHLDVTNYTLCAGSRAPDGSVPDVCWHSGRSELRVHWYLSDDRSSDVRARAAVS